MMMLVVNGEGGGCVMGACCCGSLLDASWMQMRKEFEAEF
jgi:hypothetical protein